MKGYFTSTITLSPQDFARIDPTTLEIAEYMDRFCVADFYAEFPQNSNVFADVSKIEKAVTSWNKQYLDGLISIRELAYKLSAEYEKLLVLLN